MKRLFTLSFCISFFFTAFSQVPQKFSYQAVATDDTGVELAIEPLGIQATIISGSPSGNAEWIETFDVTTDEFGLFTLEIGEGNYVGGAQTVFADIPWGSTLFFLRIDMDPTGGSNYQFVGTKPLLSVPYALYAQTADHALTADIVIGDNDTDPSNEIQEIVLDGTELSISGGDTIIDLAALPFDVNDADSDPTNEIQDFELNGTVLGLTGSSSSLDLSTLPINIEDADADPMNEIQELEVNGSTITLTSGPGGTGNSSTVNLDSLQFNVDDADADPMNEIQELFITGDTLGITNGNFLTLSDALSGAGGFNDPGATIDFPQGVTDANYIFVPDMFTVPSDKVFYITAAEDEMILPQVGNDFGRTLTGPSMPVYGPNTIIDNCRCIGFLKDISLEIMPQLIVLEENQGNFFKVPVGKNLVLKSGLDSNSPITLNNMIVNFFSGTIKALVIPGDIEIRNNGNDEIIITGYLIDNN